MVALHHRLSAAAEGLRCTLCVEMTKLINTNIIIIMHWHILMLSARYLVCACICRHRAELTFTDFIMVLAIFRPGSDAGEDAGVEATEESFPSLNSRDEKLRCKFACRKRTAIV